jgi:hypothetical protein
MASVQQLRETLNQSKFNSYKVFTDTFWRFVKEDVGVTHIYPLKASYLKKKQSFADRWGKVDALLARADFDDDKLSPSDAALA